MMPSIPNPCFFTTPICPQVVRNELGHTLGRREFALDQKHAWEPPSSSSDVPAFSSLFYSHGDIVIEPPPGMCVMIRPRLPCLPCSRHLSYTST